MVGELLFVHSVHPGTLALVDAFEVRGNQAQHREHALELRGPLPGRHVAYLAHYHVDVLWKGLASIALLAIEDGLRSVDLQTLAVVLDAVNVWLTGVLLLLGEDSSSEHGVLLSR